MRRALSLCLLLALVAAPCARAAYEPLGGGQARLLLDKRFAALLRKDGIKLTTAAGASHKGAAFTLPVSGGNLDPTIGKGEIDTGGTLIFGEGRKKLPLRRIRIQTHATPLLAKVGGSQLKLAEGARLSFAREGFDSSLRATHLLLTGKLVTRLNKKLRPKVPFEEGQLLGSLVSKASPKLVTIKDSGRATLLFDPAFLQKLESRFVSLNPIHPAEHQGPSFSFPIAIGGQLSPDGSQGTLKMGGALELLQLGGGQVFWSEPWLEAGAHLLSTEADLEPTPSFPGKVGRTALLAAFGGSASSDPGARTISASGISLTLTQAGAGELNEAFDEGKGLFVAGEAVGTLGFGAVGE